MEKCIRYHAKHLPKRFHLNRLHHKASLNDLKVRTAPHVSTIDSVRERAKQHYILHNYFLVPRQICS